MKHLVTAFSKAGQRRDWDHTASDLHLPTRPRPSADADCGDSQLLADDFRNLEIRPHGFKPLHNKEWNLFRSYAIRDHLQDNGCTARRLESLGIL